MEIYSLQFSQEIGVPLDKAWDFFSSPYNLKLITPARMGFDITSNLLEADKMYEGILISYKIAPLFRLKMTWVTEITHIREKEYFIDEQRIGPYALWHHEHHFNETASGVLMTDRLTYALPFGIVGTLTNRLLVRNEIRKIFEYRTGKIRELFPAV